MVITTPIMAKRPNKKTQQEYKDAVEYGCVVCKKLYGVKTDTCIHHLTGAGMGKKSEEIIPLCHNHHQGLEGIHHLGKKEWEKRFGSQRKLREIYLAQKDINKQ